MQCFLYNPQKSVLLERSALLELPGALVKEITPDDKYVVQAHLTAGAVAIVTTDTKLKSALHKHRIRCERRDDFVESYLSDS